MLTSSTHIHILDNCLEISNLQLQSSEAINYLKNFEGDEQIDELIKIIEVGAAVMARVNSSQEVDYVNAKINETLNSVQERFYQFEQQMRTSLDGHLNPTKTDSFLSQATTTINAQSEKVRDTLAEILRSTHDSLEKESQKIEEGRLHLDHSMDPNNSSGYLAALIKKMEQFDTQLAMQFNETDTASFVGKLRTVVQEHFGEDGKVIDLIDAKLQLDGQTPLSQVYFGLREEMTSLRDAVMKLLGQQEMLQTTTKKGFPFEEEVYDKLQEIAKPFSDVVEDTSLKAVALTGSKKGDYVYYLAGTDTSVVIDAKNYNKLKSLPGMLTYLKQAMKERGSKMGIIVAPEAKNLQKQIGSWNVFGSCIITCLDHLEVAIKYSKFILRAQETDASDINAGLIKHKLESIQRKMKEFTTVKSKLTKLTNGVSSSVNDIQVVLDGIKHDVNEKLNDIHNEFDKHSNS